MSKSASRLTHQGPGEAPTTRAAPPCSAQLQASVFPVTITPAGATPDGNGGYDILVGQHCAPTLTGIPSGCTITKEVWTTTLKTVQANSWTIAAGNASATFSGNSTVNYTENFTSNPPSAAPVWYYDDNAGMDTITCTASISPPTGQGSPFTLTVTQKVTVVVPTWSGSNGTGGYMQVNALQSGNSNIWLWAGPTSAEQAANKNYGMNWSLVVHTPQSPAFGTGQVELVQIITPSYSYTTDATPSVTHNDPENGRAGLDKQYPYLGGVSGEPQQGYALVIGDSPDLQVVSGTTKTATLDDSFTTYLMYEPPGSSSIWVPLGTFPWSTNGSTTVPLTAPYAHNWADYALANGGSDAAGTVTPSSSTPFTSAGGAYPTWNVVNVTPAF